jgi:hypothetical protein
MGLEIDKDNTEPETLCPAEIYRRGIRRWFAMFYNSNTDKFIAHFKRLMER